MNSFVTSSGAGQAEILRTVQKDLSYTQEIQQNLSELLRMSNGRQWIRYNHLCKIVAELAYHGFTSLNRLQTLGEEYTGIIQMDSSRASIPRRYLQFMAIVLEFGGELLLVSTLKKLETDINSNEDLVPEARIKLVRTIAVTRKLLPYIKAFHKSLFFLNAGHLQVSKRLTGINYVLVRHWLKENHSIYGYKMLGVLSLTQLVLSLTIYWRDTRLQKKFEIGAQAKSEQLRLMMRESGQPDNAIKSERKCVLCLDHQTATSLTECGHLFCWR
jgi:peroxin-10